jgi:hypothetical protein
MTKKRYIFEVHTGFIWKELPEGSLKINIFKVIASEAIEACEKVLKLSGAVSEDTKDFGIISVTRKDKIDA